MCQKEDAKHGLEHGHEDVLENGHKDGEEVARATGSGLEHRVEQEHAREHEVREEHESMEGRKDEETHENTYDKAFELEKKHKLGECAKRGLEDEQGYVGKCEIQECQENDEEEEHEDEEGREHAWDDELMHHPEHIEPPASQGPEQPTSGQLQHRQQDAHSANPGSRQPFSARLLLAESRGEKFGDLVERVLRESIAIDASPNCTASTATTAAAAAAALTAAGVRSWR